MQWLMLQQDKPEDYVIASGQMTSVREFIELSAIELGWNKEKGGKGIIWEKSGIDEIGKRSDNGEVVVLNKGIEQDLGTYIGNLKNPGSGWEHHFKPSSAAGMGAKPTPTSNVSPGMINPWKEGSINLTRQMILESSEPDLAAVLKKEASNS